MSTGQWIGAILGAIVGFILGNWVGLIYGAIIGYSLGGIVDPVKPDVKQPGAPAPQGLQIMTNVIGNPIFDVLGTAKITGQLLFFGKEFNRAIWYRPAKGVRAISGYKYYASWALGICMGEVDVLYTVFRDQDPIWEGELLRPESGGEATIQIEGGGTMVFYFGTDDQVPNVKAGTLIPDPTLNTGYRHLCWAFFDAFFINEYNRMPTMSFVIKKIPPMFSESKSQVQVYDINPAHALWHTLIEKAGLPVEWVDPIDFLAIATELFDEGRGISVLFDAYQATQNYLEAINSHVDCILRYGSDGKFHPKLIRYVSPVGLPVIDASKLLEEPTFSRRSWIDTINEVKVQYSEILGERITPWSEMLYDNFLIYDMFIESGNIYICGCGFDEGVRRPKVGKVDLATGELVDSFMDITNVGSYYAISVDADGVYLTGPVATGAVAHMRNKNNLSSQVWAYIASPSPSAGTGIFPEGSFVYGCCGVYIGQVAAVYKLNKSNGIVVWETIIGVAVRDLYVPSGENLYLMKEHGGRNVVATVSKATGVEVFATFNAGWPFGGKGKNGSLWTGGYHLGTASKTIVKYNVSGFPATLIWAWEEVFPATVNTAFGDDNGVYGVGIKHEVPTPFFLKLNTAGTSKVWEITDISDVNQRVYKAFCELGEILYAGTYYVGGTNINKGRICKRNKSDGNIITF